MNMVSPEEWRARGHTFEWRGERIFFRAEGSGPAVLLVHGFPTASWDWAPIWPRLTEQYRVLALDMIGFGFSAKPRRFEYSIVAQADLIGALLAREGVVSYRLVAHDYGVSVAQELLARQGTAKPGGTAAAHIVSVCLLNGGLFPETHRALRTQRILASPVGPVFARLIRYRTFAAAMRRIWGTHAATEGELRAMWSLVTESGGTAVLPKLISYMAERRAQRERWVGALVDATAPLRLINGLVDPISGAHMVARYREVVPRPDVVELPGVGHYPQIEAPAAVLAAVLEQLARA